MKTTRRPLSVIGALLLAGWFAVALGACASGEKTESGGTAEVSSASAAAGAQLWVDTCARCHNLRSPSSYSRAQWDVIVHHMRVRCYLNGADERAILAFLKAGAGSDEGVKR